jgi:DNA/RNA-binding domain of Phe-tRNA-synthetase-like protein
MAFQLEIDPRVTQKFPGYTVAIIYARGLDNRHGEDECLHLLRLAEQVQRLNLGNRPPSAHEHITAWRKAIATCGGKPGDYPTSVEALLKRVLKGTDLPSINPLVDLYNALSIQYVLPVGGEDWDHLSGNLTLTFANGTEPFMVLQNGEPTIAYPKPNEIIWADPSGVTCRMWNWRQCLRTRLTPATTNAYFVLDRLSPHPIEKLLEAMHSLEEHLRILNPHCSLHHQIFGADANI